MKLKAYCLSNGKSYSVPVYASSDDEARALFAGFSREYIPPANCTLVRIGTFNTMTGKFCNTQHKVIV